MRSISIGWLLTPLKPALKARAQAEASWRVARYGDSALAILQEELTLPGLTANRRRLLSAVAEAIRARKIAPSWPQETVDWPA